MIAKHKKALNAIQSLFIENITKIKTYNRAL